MAVFQRQGRTAGSQRGVQVVEKAAIQGNVPAQYNLAEMYSSGNYIPKDDEEAVKWYRKAAAQGNIRAQYKLGNIYYSGNYIPQDHKQAFKWYRKAAEQGHGDSQVRLGDMYKDGKGVKQDYVKAYLWFSLAATQNSDTTTHTTGWRDFIGEKLTKAQLEKAQKLSRKCLQRNYKNC